MALPHGSSTQATSVFDNKYEILSGIGRGHNSIVYKARLHQPFAPHKLGDEEFVALKVLTGNSKNPEQNLERMKREAIAMLSARNKNVIRLNDYMATGELCYLSMEYAQEGDLLCKLNSSTEPLSPNLVTQLLRQTLSGLEAIHRTGIIHRDIKPENLLLSSDGTLKVADFGIAHLPTKNPLDENVHRGIGTFEYLAPEYMDGHQNNESTDIYSLGVTMYFLLTKHLPFEGISFSEQVNNKMKGNLTPFSKHIREIPPLLDTLICKSLSHSPQNRFQTAKEFREALEPLLVDGVQNCVMSLTSNNENTSSVLQEIPDSDPKPETSTYYNFKNNHLSTNQTLISKTREANLNNTSEQKEDHLLDSNPQTEQPNHLDQALSPESHEVKEFQPQEQGHFLSTSPTPTFPIWKSFIYSKTAIVMAGLIIIFTGLALGDLELANSKGAFAKPSISTKNDILSSPASAIEQTRVGMLYNLLSNQSDTIMAINRFENSDKMLVTLGIPGWTPRIIDTSAWGQNEKVLIDGNGLQLSLWIEKNSVIDNTRISGYYQEHGSGQKGMWIIW